MRIKIDKEACVISCGDIHKRTSQTEINLISSRYGEEFEMTNDLLCDAYKSGVDVDSLIGWFKYTGLITWSDGTKTWYRDGRLHREDGPAVEWPTGTREWYRNGWLHREDGPAIDHSNGTRMWYRNGELHREDGPAIEWYNGVTEYYREGFKVEEDELDPDEGECPK